ncbi:MAG TPA: hypothetical protein VFF81_08535 [Noviherbaspirillum sp.]|nr:hypothetical protein [Noviherbaspirillum sp.]
MKRLFIAFAVSALGACASTPHDVEPSLTYKKFSARLNEPLEVETGEALFVEGGYIEGQFIKVNEPLDMMIPGAMLIPFPVHIAPGTLKMTRISMSGRYFCADEDKASASFPGLGSVIKTGDCVGIRISPSKKFEWVVDNSNHNRATTIWTRAMSDDEVQRYQSKVSNVPFKYDSLKRIVFNGYYGGQLHFTYEELGSSSKESKEFVFDFAGKPTLVSIKGNRFEVQKADNIKLVYSWQKFN